VYEGEPAVHPGLLALDNVVLLPHIGSATETARRAIVQMAVDNVIAFFDTGRPLHPVY
jgi:gluconate 2-dehydrogenase